MSLVLGPKYLGTKTLLAILQWFREGAYSHTHAHTEMEGRREEERKGERK